MLFVGSYNDHPILNNSTHCITCQDTVEWKNLVELISLPSVQGNSSPKVRHRRRVDHLKRSRCGTYYLQNKHVRGAHQTQRQPLICRISWRDHVSVEYIQNEHVKTGYKPQVALQFRLRAFYLMEQPISLTIRNRWPPSMKEISKETIPAMQ